MTILGRALIYFNGNEEKVYEILMKSSKLDDLIVLEDKAEKVTKELEKIKKQFEKQKEVMGDMIFFEFSSKYGIKSILINMLSAKNKNKTLVFFTKSGQRIRVSLRRMNRKIKREHILYKSILLTSHDTL